VRKKGEKREEDRGSQGVVLKLKKEKKNIKVKISLESCANDWSIHFIHPTIDTERARRQTNKQTNNSIVICGLRIERDLVLNNRWTLIEGATERREEERVG
jgi:hypothetical protein